MHSEPQQDPNMVLKLVLMSIVKVVEDFTNISEDASGTLVQRTSFFFDLPAIITLPSPKGDIIRNLPPSIRVLHTGSSYSNKHPSTCDVSYGIIARVFADGRLASDVQREIILMPTTEIPPPQEPEDFKNEYNLNETLVIGLQSWSKRCITVVVSSVEPRPIVFPTDGYGGSTDIILHFTARLLSNKISDQVRLVSQLSNCKVSSTLHAATYFLAHEQTSAMSLSEASRSSSVILKLTNYDLDKSTLPLNQWSKSSSVPGMVPTTNSLHCMADNSYQPMRLWSWKQ